MLTTFMCLLYVHVCMLHCKCDLRPKHNTKNKSFDHAQVVCRAPSTLQALLLAVLGCAAASEKRLTNAHVWGTLVLLYLLLAKELSLRRQRLTDPDHDPHPPPVPQIGFSLARET